MIATINLDDETKAWGEEVDDEAKQWHLPANAGTGDAGAKGQPEHFLRASGSGAKSSSTCVEQE